MTPFKIPLDARAAINGFGDTYASKLPEQAVTAFVDARNTLDLAGCITQMMEVAYAFGSKVDDPDMKRAFLTLGAQCAQYASEWNWHGKNDDNRASLMKQAMLRDAGEEAPAGAPWPDPKDDPAPDAVYTTALALPPIAPALTPEEQAMLDGLRAGTLKTVAVDDKAP